MQKLIKIILLTPFLFLACVNQKTEAENKNCVTFDSGFTICRDTIFVDIRGGMRNALKFNDKFYVIFSWNNLMYGDSRSWLYVFSNGEIENIVNVPQRMSRGHLDFFVKNDSIILQQYMSDVHFHFDTKSFTWEEIFEADNLIFEDDRFYVFSLDFGQWGGRTWFRDKKTGLEYKVNATTPLINKIDTVYYLTEAFRVLRIENPLHLNKVLGDFTYERVVASRIGHLYDFDGSKGFEVVFEAVFPDYYYDFFPLSYIVSSFVWQNELLHIYETDTATYIARIENNSIKPIQKIAEDLRFFRWFDAYRRRNMGEKNELLMFRTNDEQVFGLMEIIDNKILLHYFVNEAVLVPKLMGEEKADSIFIKRLNLILTDLGSLQLSKVDSLEQKWGAFDVTPSHRVGISESLYPNPNKFELDTLNSYLILEDYFISNAIRYFATKSNDLVRVISMDWRRNFTGTRHWLLPNYQKILNDAFQEKLIFLESHLQQEFGEPAEIIRQQGRHFTRIWKTPCGFTIRLANSTHTYNFIRMTIYRD